MMSWLSSVVFEDYLSIRQRRRVICGWVCGWVCGWNVIRVECRVMDELIVTGLTGNGHSTDIPDQMWSVIEAQ